MNDRSGQQAHLTTWSWECFSLLLDHLYHGICYAQLKLFNKMDDLHNCICNFMGRISNIDLKKIEIMTLFLHEDCCMRHCMCQVCSTLHLQSDVCGCMYASFSFLCALFSSLILMLVDIVIYLFHDCLPWLCASAHGWHPSNSVVFNENIMFFTSPFSVLRFHFQTHLDTIFLFDSPGLDKNASFVYVLLYKARKIKSLLQVSFFFPCVGQKTQ